MIRVVRIEPYKNRNKVVLDNEEKFLLYKGDIRKFKLESNQEISKVTYNEIKQLLYERGKERALYILDKTFKTEKQIKDKLIQEMYPEDVIKRILEFLKKYDIINDKRYASMYIEYKGKTQDLMIKGISQDIISESFESTDYSDADSLKKIIDKRAKRYNLDDRKDLQKLYQYLMGKGYKYSDIKNELSEYFEHLESQFDDEI
mgnify:CR=1 FL=1